MLMYSLIFPALATAARTIEYDTLIGDFSNYERGLYQSALDTETNRLYVTSSLGRITSNVSNLLAVDPDNLTVLQDIALPLVDNTSDTVWAVYGMSLHQAKGRIWTSHAGQKSVSYYNADDLTLGNRWPINTENGAREVWADEETGLAYVGSSESDCVYVYSYDKKDAPLEIINITEKTGTRFFRVMTFSGDLKERILYTASWESNLAAAINLEDYSAKVYQLGNVNSSSGVAIDTKRKYLYVSNQQSNNTVVLDTKSGKVLKEFKDLGAPLSTKYDANYDVVYIACRTGSKVVVIDASDFSTITELSVGTPNHVLVGPAGEIYVTDKSSASNLYKFTPVREYPST